MKEFSYYTENCQFPSKLSIRKKVYEDFKFNPDNYDSKSEEKRVIEELDKKAADIYMQNAKRVKETYEEFKKDIFEEFEIENNPKRELFYQLAWFQACSHGESFEEVYDIIERWVELIKD